MTVVRRTSGLRTAYRRGLAVAGVAAIASAGLLLAAGSASATTFVNCSSVKQTNGTYTVTYTVNPDIHGYPWKFAVLSDTPAGSTLSNYPTSGTNPPNSSDTFQIVQSNIPGTATSASITTQTDWPTKDDNTNPYGFLEPTVTSSVTLGTATGVCGTPVIGPTPPQNTVPPTSTPPTSTTPSTSPTVTVAPPSTTPVTTAPVTTAPITTAPITTTPITTTPITTTPITTAPITTAPGTTSPAVVTAPVTTAPVTTSPAVVTTPVTSPAPTVSTSVDVVLPRLSPEVVTSTSAPVSPSTVVSVATSVTPNVEATTAVDVPTQTTTALAYTGVGEPVGHTVGLAVGLSLLGGLCLLAARKRQRS